MYLDDIVMHLNLHTATKIIRKWSNLKNLISFFGKINIKNIVSEENTLVLVWHWLDDRCPPKAALSLSSSAGQGITKADVFLGWVKGRERSSTNDCHGPNRLHLGKLNLLPIITVNSNLKLTFPSLSPSLVSASLLISLPVPSQGHRGTGNGGCHQLITHCLYCSFFLQGEPLTPFPCSRSLLWGAVFQEWLLQHGFSGHKSCQNPCSIVDSSLHAGTVFPAEHESTAYVMSFTKLSLLSFRTSQSYYLLLLTVLWEYIKFPKVL